MNERQVHDALVQEFIARGRLIEAGFLAMRMAVIKPDAPPLQVAEMRLAFMAGAQHLFSSIISALDPGIDPTDADLKRMDLINAEMVAFGKELELRVAKTGRSQ